MHGRREIQSLELHRRIVGRMGEDAAAVIQKARGNLHRWLSMRPDDGLSATWREWELLLREMTPGELGAFLVSDSPRAVRLRQSSPFAGVLPARDVWEIKKTLSRATP